MVLVPVRRNAGSINGGEIETELNKIYGLLGIHFTVTIVDPFGDGEDLSFLDDIAQMTDKSFWGNESEQMAQLRLMYHNKNADEIANNSGAAYLFVIGGFDTDPTVQGDMPRGKSVGYIFDNSSSFRDGRLVAHELGHGLFTLQHTFAGEYGVPQEHDSYEYTQYE